MTPKPSEIWRAFAKVNLELRVLGKRPDGYHDICSVLQTIDLHDEIRVISSRTFDFKTNRGPEDASNLVVCAVQAFQRETGMDVPLRLQLTKRIPMGAGLGGGSADAATTLLGLNRRFNARIPSQRMYEMLCALGSDVPFFGVGGRALATGRGENLFPMSGEGPYWLVLVVPDLTVHTAEAYSWLTESPGFNNMLSFCAHFVSLQRKGRVALETGPNDFEAPLFSRFPELAEIKQRLSALGARFASLTGSGSTVFGQFTVESAARAAAQELGRELDVIVARPVGRPDYFGTMFQRQALSD